MDLVRKNYISKTWGVMEFKSAFISHKGTLE